jgi:light-regulated signal transduction histidine kinase (bacteriophytochrome)
VAERTAQLEAANKELEAFSYTVSHDLRAPLRAVDGFTRILLEEYAPQFDAEGRRFCGLISNNTRRMGELIDDLLAFSRLGRAKMHPAPVDMASLANATFLELTALSERARIDFHLEPLPPATGDPALLRQVWANLLANAVKFSAKKERPSIEVRGVQQGGAVVYSIRDNGAGFDMRYVDKLFGVFQRLHNVREFEGTGVGLAIVQRIVHRHGGRVWAEGAPGEGATFYFTLHQEGS